MKQETRRARLVFLVILVTLVAVAIGTLGCATAHKTPSDAGQVPLHTGMTAEQVRAMYGSPDREYDATFGEDIGEPWTGRVWLYFTKQDPAFKYVKRYKKNVFVFYPASGSMKLNNWNIEE